MRDPRDFQFDLPPSRRPPEHALCERIHDAAWRSAPTCTSARRGDPLRTIRAIVIHATAGASTEGAISVMRERRASFHWIIPDENESAHGRWVWATAPERRAAWHVRYQCSHKDVCNNARGLNQLSLGVELVNSQQAGDAFSDWQISAAAAIIRYTWAKYPNLRHVVSHACLDPERRTDPGAHFPWEAFEERILNPSF